MVEISNTWMIILVIGSIIGYSAFAAFGVMIIWYAIDEITGGKIR